MACFYSYALAHTACATSLLLAFLALAGLAAGLLLTLCFRPLFSAEVDSTGTPLPPEAAPTRLRSAAFVAFALSAFACGGRRLPRRCLLGRLLDLNAPQHDDSLRVPDAVLLQTSATIPQCGGTHAASYPKIIHVFCIG